MAEDSNFDFKHYNLLALRISVTCEAVEIDIKDGGL